MSLSGRLVTGGVQPVEPDWSVRGFDAYSPGGIVAHHLAAGLLYILLRMGNIDVWDLGLYIAGTEAIVQRSCSKAAMECEDGWLDVPDVLAFYDYVGHNPAKGGLFRVGAMNSGTSGAVMRFHCFVFSFFSFILGPYTYATLGGVTDDGYLPCCRCYLQRLLEGRRRCQLSSRRDSRMSTPALSVTRANPASSRNRRSVMQAASPQVIAIPTVYPGLSLWRSS